jgi:hypothetical protein
MNTNITACHINELSRIVLNLQIGKSANQYIMLKIDQLFSLKFNKITEVFHL